MYNSDLNYGSWPGPGKTFYPLLTTAANPQNPIMSMVDANGNLLIVTGFGVTGAAAPVLPALSAEGATVTDGTVTWTVVAATSRASGWIGCPTRPARITRSFRITRWTRQNSLR